MHVIYNTTMHVHDTPTNKLTKNLNPQSQGTDWLCYVTVVWENFTGKIFHVKKIHVKIFSSS